MPVYPELFFRNGLWTADVTGVPGAGALAIARLTVSFQSRFAALMNPVKSLRSA